MSQDRRIGRAGRGGEEQRQGAGGELPAHVRLARHLARARQTRERLGHPGPGAPTLSVTATDAPALPAREAPPPKAHPTDPDDMPPLPPREMEERSHK